MSGSTSRLSSSKTGGQYNHHDANMELLAVIEKSQQTFGQSVVESIVEGKKFSRIESMKGVIVQGINHKAQELEERKRQRELARNPFHIAEINSPIKDLAILKKYNAGKPAQGSSKPDWNSNPNTSPSRMRRASSSSSLLLRERKKDPQMIVTNGGPKTSGGSPHSSPSPPLKKRTGKANKQIAFGTELVDNTCASAESPTPQELQQTEEATKMDPLEGSTSPTTQAETEDCGLESPVFLTGASSAKSLHERLLGRLMGTILSVSEREEIQMKFLKIVKWFHDRRLFPPLSLTDIQGSGLMEYFECCWALHRTPVAKLVCDLQHKVLNLCNMKLRAAEMEPMAQALKVNHFVSSLHLAFNGFDATAALHLSSAIQVNSTITHLDLSHNKIGDGLQHLAAAIAKTKSIRTLLIGGCGLRDKAIGLFCEGLLLDKQCPIVTLDLSHNDIQDAGAASLAKALKNNRTLLDLDLSYNKMRGPGSLSIANGLAENRTLTRLCLSWNGVGREAAGALGRALTEESVALRALEIDQCQIDSVGMMMIAQGIEKNDKLAYIDLKRNNIADDGARALFKALGINRSVTRFDMRGCNVQDNNLTMFDESNPTGSYRLELSDAYDRSVAQKLQELEAGDQGTNWLNVRYNGEPLEMRNIQAWKIPDRGTLQLDYKSGKKVSTEFREMDPEDIDSLCFQLSSKSLTDLERVSILRIAASVEAYTCEQADRILATFNDDNPVRESKLNGFLVLFGRLLDRQHMPDMIRKQFNKQEIKILQEKLGNLLSFNLDSPSGHYEFNLAVDYERDFATMLYNMSQTEEGGNYTFIGQQTNPAKSKQYGVRTAILDGEPYRFDPQGELPQTGRLVIDYIASKGPDPTKWKVLDIHDIRALLEQKEEEGWDENRFTEAVHDVVSDKAISGDTVTPLLSLFKDSANKVKVAKKMFFQMVERNQTMHKIFDPLKGEEQVMLSDELGNINVFDPKHPYRHWRLDLSKQVDRYVADRLAKMALKMSGENWKNETLDGQEFRFSENYAGFVLPTAGILELDFVPSNQACGPAGPSFYESGLKTLDFKVKSVL